MTKEAKIAIEEARIFAKYIGCELDLGDGQIVILTGVLCGANGTVDLFDDSSKYALESGNYKLRLTSLQNISDEHAIEVAKMASVSAMQYHKPEDISYEIMQNDGVYTRVIIKSRGLPYALVSIKPHGVWVFPFNGSAFAVDKPTFTSNQWSITDFLRSQGYDLDNLISTGIAIEKEGKDE